MNLPVIRYERPQYFAYLVGQIGVHILLSISGVLGKHQSSVWDWFGGQIGMHILGFMHLVIAVAMIYGTYGSYAVTRYSLIASLAIYIVSACFFLNAFLYPLITTGEATYSGEGIAYCAGLAWISATNYRHSRVHEIRVTGDLV
jgi:hypothetical protein